jgi:hypothetical protein
MPTEILLNYSCFKSAINIFEIIFGIENIYKAIDNSVDKICKGEDELFIKKTKLRFKLMKKLDKFGTEDINFISILLVVFASIIKRNYEEIIQMTQGACDVVFDKKEELTDKTYLGACNKMKSHIEIYDTFAKYIYGRTPNQMLMKDDATELLLKY